MHRRRRRRQWKHPSAAPLTTTAPSQIWTIDFERQFRIRNRVYCYPLTVLDHFSRNLLCRHGLRDVNGAGVTPPTAFNRFERTYNELRPYEALDDCRPATRWAPSARPFPERIRPPEYPGHFVVWRVSNAGTFRFHAGQCFLSQALDGDYIGLEEVEDGRWNILYYETLLGRVRREHQHHHRRSIPPEEVLTMSGRSVSYVPGCSLVPSPPTRR